MKILLTAAIALCISVSSRAEADGRAELIHEIVQIQGVDEMLRDAKTSAAAQAQGIVKQMFDQIRAGMPSLPNEKLEEIRAAAEKLMRAVDSSWTPEDAIRVWEAEFVTDFTESELRAFLESCKTPLGKKQIAAGKRAGSALQRFLLESGKSKMDAAVAEYISDVQKIVAAAAPAK